MRVLALIVGVAAIGCVSNPTPVIALGPWGGPHVSMQVSSSGAQLDYDCAAGTIDEPLRPNSEGRFTAVGLHTPGHGGPIRIGEILPAFRARYDGQLTGDRLNLVITLTDTGVTLGSFELQRGSSGMLMRCL